MTAITASAISTATPRPTGVICDLAFSMAERPEGWSLCCQYSTDLYDPGTIERLLHHYANLLRAATVDVGDGGNQQGVLRRERFFCDRRDLRDELVEIVQSLELRPQQVRFDHL